jgi:hypothetical protein
MKRFYFISILVSILIIILSVLFIIEFKIQETFMSTQNILVIGDSHTQVFKYCNDKNTGYNFDVQKVSGATAQGSVNPNSKTNALNIFREYLKNINCDKYKYILIMLGEVDCGFVFWVRSKRYNISVDDQMKSSLNNLWEFIDNEVHKYFDYDKIILAGAPLPTIKDNANKKFLNGARAEVTENQEIRTIKTLEYNSLLKKQAEEKGCKYIDITNNIIQNKKVNDIYLSDDESDHHLSNERTYNFWLNNLNNVTNSLK